MDVPLWLWLAVLGGIAFVAIVRRAKLAAM